MRIRKSIPIATAAVIAVATLAGVSAETLSINPAPTIAPPPTAEEQKLPPIRLSLPN